MLYCIFLSSYVKLYFISSAEPCIQMSKHWNGFSVTVVTNGCTVTVLALMQKWSQRTCHSIVDVTLINHILIISMYFTFANKLQVLHYKYIQCLSNSPISFYRTLSMLKQGLVVDTVMTDQDIMVNKTNM